MSDNKKNPSNEEQDQQFIDALYNDLDKSSSPSVLDDKILAAAHKAVEAKPALVKKRPRWLKPMSAAAMVMLVTSVSIHQLQDPSAPLDADAYISESLYLEDNQSQFERSSESVSVAKPALKEKAKYKPKPKAKMEAKAVAKKAMRQSSEVNALRMKARIVSPSSFEPALEQSSIAYADAARSQPSSFMAHKVITLEQKSVALGAAAAVSDDETEEAEEILPSVVLNRKTFRIAEGDVWIYQQEDDDYYWLLSLGTAKIQYRLDKTIFTLLEEKPLIQGDVVHVKVIKGRE